MLNGTDRGRAWFARQGIPSYLSRCPADGSTT